MQWSDVLLKVQSSIEKHQMLPPDARVLVAVSGGPDSIFLAYALHQLGYSIGLAHVNYNLRGEDSDWEEKLVRDYAQKWQVPVFVQVCDPKAHAEVHNLSLQVAARRLRYRFFDQLLEEEDFSYCATGHHANDQVESILMSFLRGNSPRILNGIPLRRGPYVRPCIELNKTDILHALEDQGLEYGLDYTNYENTYLRNQFRNQMLPVLHHINPSIGSQILSRHAWYKQQHDFMQFVLDRWLDQSIRPEIGGERLRFEAFASEMGESFLPQLIIAAGQKWGWHGQTLWRLLELQKADTGKQIKSKAGTVYRVDDGLFFLPVIDQQLAEPILLTDLNSPGELHWRGRTLTFHYPVAPPFQFEANVFFLDPQKLNFPLKISSWQEGDRMQPYGMQRMKKLSDIFVDEKFNPAQKELAVVISDQEKIVALSDFRIAETVKVNAQTTAALKIVIHS
jgi:tRNA(Ile)-lysidine synthase